jgi:hypothetical protein
MFEFISPIPDFYNNLHEFDSIYNNLDHSLNDLKSFVESKLDSVHVNKYEGKEPVFSLLQNSSNIAESVDYHVKIVKVESSHSLDSSDNIKKIYYQKLANVYNLKYSLYMRICNMTKIKIMYLENANNRYNKYTIYNCCFNLADKKAKYNQILTKYKSTIIYKHLNLDLKDLRK